MFRFLQIVCVILNRRVLKLLVHTNFSFRDLVMLMLHIYAETVLQNRTDTATDSCLMVN